MDADEEEAFDLDGRIAPVRLRVVSVAKHVAANDSGAEGGHADLTGGRTSGAAYALCWVLHSLSDGRGPAGHEGFSAAIDLGCGNGLVGILTARLFPRTRVLITDGSTKFVALAESNARLNGACPDVVQARRLEWGNRNDIHACLDAVEGRPVLVVGADLIYAFGGAISSLIG